MAETRIAGLCTCPTQFLAVLGKHSLIPRTLPRYSLLTEPGDEARENILFMYESLLFTFLYVGVC